MLYNYIMKLKFVYISLQHIEEIYEKTYIYKYLTIYYLKFKFLIFYLISI